MGLSLTKKQVQSGPGAELLRVLSEGAEADWVSDDQIRNLDQWLHTNSNSTLPAVAFLAKLTKEVLSNGQVTGDGRHALRLAIERILPPDQRDLAKFRRRKLEGDERARAKEAKRVQKEIARDYARLSRPRSFNFMVAGTTHEGRAETIREYVAEEQRVFLVREPQNRYDSKAIGIWAGSGDRPPSSEQTTYTLQTYDIGYVPRDVAAVMAPLLDAGYKQLAICTKILRNSSRGPIPIIDVSLYHPEGNAPREATALSIGHSTQGYAAIDNKPHASGRAESLIPRWLILILILVVFLSLIVFLSSH